MEQKQILSLLVHNHPGVLLRITGLFTRRGSNIDSLTVSPSQDGAFSRMTIMIRGDSATVVQVIRQVKKIADVKRVELVPREQASCGELLLLKINAAPPQRPALLKKALAHHAAVVDIGPHSMTLQACALPEELDELVSHFVQDGVLELARTGLTALQAGDACLRAEESL